MRFTFFAVFFCMCLCQPFAAHAAPPTTLPVVHKPDGSLEIKRDKDGEFHVEALVNDQARIRFTIDKNTADIVIKSWDAKRLGIDLTSLRFSRTYSRKNGMISGAALMLNTVEFEKKTFKDVQSYVLGGDLDESILGTDFLNRFKHYRFDGDVLTLVP